MKNSTVRLSAISISNLKNIKYGEINFQNATAMISSFTDEPDVIQF